ncbi:MAG: HlyD family efflux transporter periplasmic adaptor subunit [Bacteroidota bacterium]|nr:HlyD family efflux transporter periplasmic adaptor subunit [Bacteroidota bacterium]
MEYKNDSNDILTDETFNIDRLYSIKLVNSSRKRPLIVRWIGGIFLVAVLSLFLPWQQSIDGSGIVTAFSPKDRPQTIQSLIAGRIEKWYAREGQFVNQGDTILAISEIKEKFLDPMLIQRLEDQIKAKRSSIASKQEKADALRKQIQALKASLQFSINKAKNKVQQYGMYVQIDSVEYLAARADNEIAQKQLERQQKLFDQGLVSLTQLEQRNLKFQQTNAKYISAYNKYSAAKNDLINTEIELNSLNAEYQDKISKAESDLNATLSDLFESDAIIQKLSIELSNMIIRNKMYIIRAPQDGYMVRAIKQGLGETIKEGEEIATIMPDKPELAVELYIKPVDLPLVYIGCPVRLQFDGWPAIIFAGWPGASSGTFGGKVAVIDYVNSSNGKFRLLITPDSTVEWPHQLRIGTGVSGWAMLKNVMLGYEMWRQFNGFPPEFTQNISRDMVYKKGKKLQVKKDKKDKDNYKDDED